MPAERRAWSQEELLIVFRLYCRTPFGRLHQRNPEIVELARLIGRTPGAVAMKACNFASLDPQQQARSIKALGNVSRADHELWEAFANNSEAVAQEAEKAYAVLTGKEPEEYLPELGFFEKSRTRAPLITPRDRADRLKLPKGPTEIETTVKARRVQSFFRAAVLASYENRCALTGLAIPELLNASHIIPWSVDSARRADPRNGICLNALHDRAFDRGLLTFDESFRAVLSPRIAEADECPLHKELLLNIAGSPLRLPVRFQPESQALEYHRKNIFRG